MSQYFIDFNDYADISEVLAEWTPRFDALASHYSLVTYDGKKRLKHTGGSGDHMLSFNPVDDAGNKVEILLKLRVSATDYFTDLPTPALSAWQNTTFVDFMQGYYSSTDSYHYLESHGYYGEYSQASGDPIDQVGKWFWVRLRQNGSTVYYKSWTDDVVEPGAWKITKTFANPTTGGWFGMITRNADANIHYLAAAGFGTNGDVAPAMNAWNIPATGSSGKFNITSPRRFKALDFRTLFGQGGVVASDAFFAKPPSGDATLSIVSHSADKISDETGKTVCSVVFSTDQAIGSWEARATYESQTPGPGVGWVVGSGGSISAGGTGSFDVDYTELTYGDRVYTITVYQLS